MELSDCLLLLQSAYRDPWPTTDPSTSTCMSNSTSGLNEETPMRPMAESGPECAKLLENSLCHTSAARCLRFDTPDSESGRRGVS